MFKLKIHNYNTFSEPLGKRKLWTSFLQLNGQACDTEIDLTKSAQNIFKNNLPLQVRYKSEKTQGAATKPQPTSDVVGGGNSATYVEEMYNSWKRDPGSVHTSWNSFFESGAYECVPAESVPQRNLAPLSHICGYNPKAEIIEGHLQMQNIIRSYQTRGFLVADLDPLGIKQIKKTSLPCGTELRADDSVLIELKEFLQDGKYMDCSYKLPSTTMIGGKEKELTLREVLKRLENIYCNTMGVEYMYIYSDKKRDWLRKRMETPGAMETCKEKKLLIMKRLLRTSRFEAFLAKKWSAEKRFGIEGCDIVIPCMKEIIDKSSELGVESFIIGLAHRGRLNTLSNVCRIPLDQLFAQFHSLKSEDLGSGDVKYHLGTHIQRLNRQTNKNVRITLVANASHLESVNPVAQGRTRSEQFYRGDNEGRKVMCILLHGDAAFCGQGVVYESMHLSDLPNYTVHGIVHIVINNQIGFTTDPRFSRSSPHCTDVARVVNAPIFHVNADDPEAAVYLSSVAAEWRHDWRQDVVIDLTGYRRMGHNEADEPMFTQPLMYAKIRQHKPVFDLYSEKLVNEKVISKEELDKEIESYDKILEEGFEAAKKLTAVKIVDWLDSPWTGFFQARDPNTVTPTGVSCDILQYIGQKFSSPPPPERNMVLHRGIERMLALRKQMVDEGIADWALGEALAFGTLLKEGIHVRLSGEDVERGTFSHRHHVLHHQTIDSVTYNSLDYLYPDQAEYSLCNSSLSEYAILGFEHGYSFTNPNSLVMWEAQFGDFCNTAQCIYDQYISSGEMKWARQSGVVILLPHGQEGQGPEHSSARVERFLQMCDDDPDVKPECGENIPLKQLQEVNWIVANCTVPANLFHILRRQVYLPFRKPLILFTPKTGLRHPLARSNFSEMAENTEFRRIIPDDGPASKKPNEVCKLIFCSGKVFYDLFKARANKRAEKDMAIVRIEQLCPFPYDLVREQILFYKNSELVWAQEEPKNQGPWQYVQPRFKTAMSPDFEDGFYIDYQGRPVEAAPATGNKQKYLRDFENIMNGVFGELTEEDKAFIKARDEAEAKARKEADEKAKSVAAASKEKAAKVDEKSQAAAATGKEATAAATATATASPKPAEKVAPAEDKKTTDPKPKPTGDEKTTDGSKTTDGKDPKKPDAPKK